MNAVITPVQQTYRRIRFRSTLEADWAATLDSLGIVWSYEPDAVRLPSGEFYRPDFWLPEITTWLEVKGSHDERIGKARELAEAVAHDPSYCAESVVHGECSCLMGPRQLVVIGREPRYGSVTFEPAANESHEITLLHHEPCGKFSFFEQMGGWTCRACRATGKVYAAGTEYYSGGEEAPSYPMARAPRVGRP